MTTPTFTTEAAVRAIIDLNAAATSRYSSDTIGSNIRTAAWYLERATQRMFRDETSTLKFTTNNQASTYIPGLRTASSVTLNGATLAADSSYWLIPDVQQSGVFTAVQTRPFNRGSGSNWYLGIPDWFDRNLDSPKWNAGLREGSLPNDLVITGNWGYTDTTLPEPIRDATTRLAAFLTLRSDALLSGARQTDVGIFDLSAWPIEVQSFVHSWRTGAQAVGL